MGKLVEALRRRQKALEDHKRAPHQPYEKNPTEGYRYTERLIELNYLNEKAASLLSVALKRLTPEQRKQFFNQSLNDNAKQNFSYRGYQAIMNKAFNAENQIEALTNTFTRFADSGVFGRPLEKVLSSLETLVSPRTLEKARKGQDPNTSAAEKMARLYCEMEEKEKDKIHELMSPAGKQAICDLTMERYVQENRIGPILRNEKNCREGSTWMENFGILEQLLGEQAVDEIAGQIDGLIPPKQSPDKTVRPRQADIDKLRADIRPEDPEAAEKQGLLDRAADYLVYPSAEYLEYLDTYDAKSVAGADGLGTGNSALGYYTLQQGIESLADGKFKDRIPGQKSNYTDYINYSPTDVQPLHRGHDIMSGVDLTEEELEELRKAGQAGIEPKTSQAIQEVISGIEALGEKNYQIPQAAVLVEGSWDNPVKLEYKAEQGNKKYAFWPLVNAKTAMDRAVQTGDWEEIRKTVAEYERCKAITDKMMRTVNELSQEPCYPGNVNSTRPEMAEPFCPMPTEYLEDFPGHSRVNGIYQLYAMSKNTGYPVSRILQDPAGIMNELAQDYLQNRLLSAQRGKPLGARLAMGFNGTLCQQAQTDWTNTMSPISRGLEAVVGLMPDAQQRQACAVRNYCALAVANYAVRKELTPWITLSNNSAEKMTAAARMALLTPENEFDLADVGLKLGKDDWPKTLDPDGLTDRLQKEGKLTPAQLIAKSKQLIAEAAEAEKGLAKRFKPTHDSLYPIRQAAIQTCERFLRNASPAQRKEQGYRDLAAHVASLRNDLFKADYSLQNERLKNWTARYKQNLNVLKQDKRGWFLSSKNSEEYGQMMKPMRRLNAKLDLLTGNVENLNENTRKKGEALDIKNLMDEARQKAYAYACKKSDSGTSLILHEAGNKRFWAAFDNCCVIGEMADQLGIRSPAERIVDNVQLSALKNRNTGGWEREQCEKHAARSLLAQSIRHTTASWEEQERLLQPKEMNKAIEKIMKTDAFRQMVKKEGLSGLADIILQGADALTTAYRNALVQKNGPQAAEEPSKLTREQTAEFWRSAEAPDKAPAPAAQQPGLQ